jgi:hypothetical protein
MSYTSPARPTETVVVSDRVPPLRSGISWGAVLAGGLLALALAATLNILGAGFAAMSVDATARSTPDAGTFTIGAAIWMVLVYAISLFVGGYTAARLSGTFSDTDGVLHGLSVWAIVLLISAMMLGNIVWGVASGAVQATGQVLGGAASVVSSVAERAIPAVTPEALVERAQNALRGGGQPPQQMTTEQRSAEIATLLQRRIADGAFTPEDRARLNALVAAEAGISEQEAAQRVQAAETEAQQTAQRIEAEARAAADAAAEATYMTAFATFGALLLGALAAVLGARRGTREVHLARGVAYDTAAPHRA